MEIQDKKFPKGVLSFYTELYCKRKSETENDTSGNTHKCSKQEALKSWISLNKEEKDFFQTKYNEYQINFRKSLAMHLKNVEPYLKSKVTTSTRRNSSPNISNNINNETKSENELMSTKQEINDNEGYADQTLDSQCEEMEFYDNEISNIQSPLSNSQEDVISIPEPTAPKIMTGKELFLMIQEREDGLVWEEMTKHQKRRYANAVLAIKKNYVRQYRDYLEQLPSKKLFDHYRNVVNSVYHEDWYKKNKC